MDKQAGHQLEQADKWFGARGPGQLAPEDNLVHSSRHRKPHSRWGNATEWSVAGRGGGGGGVLEAGAAPPTCPLPSKVPGSSSSRGMILFLSTRTHRGKFSMETSAPPADNAFCKDMAWSCWDMLPREASCLGTKSLGVCCRIL